MSFSSWLQKLGITPASSRSESRRGVRHAAPLRLKLERLEERRTLSFAWIGNFPTGPTPAHSVVTGDFTGDGNLDVATAADTFSLLPGNGDGTLQQPIQIEDLPSTPPGPPTDFTSDGIGDWVYVDSYKGMVAVRPGRGDGTFSDPIYSLAQNLADVVALAAADVNGDGRLDLVLANLTMDMGGMANVLLGRGDGRVDWVDTFQLGVDPSMYVGGTPSSLALGDFDADDRPDIAVVGTNYTGEGLVAILRNDGDWHLPFPAIVIHDSSVAERNTGAVAATFSVTLSAPSAQPVTVAYSTASRSAGAGSDYEAKSGTLTIPAGQISGTITVQVIGDRLPESNETFVVNLSNPTNATVIGGQGVGTIIDDEPQISISDVSKSEGKKNQTTLFTFTVTLSAAYDQPVTMSFKTVDGGAKSSDQDYIAKTGTLTFAPGETTKTITITVYGDSKKESNETFYLDLYSNSSNSQFKKNRGIATILNDD